jgi:Trypsin-like peptidase domain
MNKPKLRIEHLPISTVRIECDGPDGNSVGTGFLWTVNHGDAPLAGCIITNRHVVEGSTRGRFALHRLGADGKRARGEVEWYEGDDFGNQWIPHPDGVTDLCALDITSFVEEGRKGGPRLRLPPLDLICASAADWASLAPIEDVLMFGYPAGRWDPTNKLPIARRGITATDPTVDYGATA